MQLKHEIHWPDKLAEGITRSCTYFEQAGFKKRVIADDKVVFHQGNLWQNQFTFDPLKWKSKIALYHEEESLMVLVDLDTRGQLVRPGELLIWEKFINEWGQYVQQPVGFQSAITKQRWSNRLGNARMFAVLLLIVASSAFVGGVLGYLTKINIVLTVTMSMAAGSLLVSKYLKI